MHGDYVHCVLKHYKAPLFLHFDTLIMLAHSGTGIQIERWKLDIILFKGCYWCQGVPWVLHDTLHCIRPSFSIPWPTRYKARTRIMKIWHCVHTQNRIVLLHNINPTFLGAGLHQHCTLPPSLSTSWDINYDHFPFLWPYIDFVWEPNVGPSVLEERKVRW